LRRLGLQATELAHAQVATIRLRLLKIGAHIRVTVRKVWLSLPRSYPWPDLFQRVHCALTG
jgi:Transposase DDE domain group 1